MAYLIAFECYYQTYWGANDHLISIPKLGNSNYYLLILHSRYVFIFQDNNIIEDTYSAALIVISS